MTSSGISATLMSFIRMPSDLMSCSSCGLGLRAIPCGCAVCPPGSGRWLLAASGDRMASLPPRLRRLQFAQLFLGLLQLGLELLFLGAELASALRRSASTRSNGREYGRAAANADEIVAATEIVDRIPDQLAVVARTAARWSGRRNCAAATHMKSASRSVSAMTTMLSGLAEALSASAAAVTPAGGPSGYALAPLPETRAATTYSPVGLKPSRSAAGVAHHREALRGQQARPACWS